MKIICIGRNYTAHINELENERPEEPVVFIKPDSSVLPKQQDFYPIFRIIKKFMELIFLSMLYQILFLQLQSSYHN